jgi:hypothetical protein
MFKYILDFSSLDFARLSDDRRCYTLRDLAIMQNFLGLLRSYGLSRPSILLVFHPPLLSFLPRRTTAALFYTVPSSLLTFNALVYILIN